MTEDGGAALTVSLENQALVVFQGVKLAPEKSIRIRNKTKQPPQTSSFDSLLARLSQ